MGLFRRRREEEQRSLPAGAQLLGLSGGSPYTRSGEVVTGDGALRLSAVWACVRLLADTISSLPVHTYRGDEQVDTPALLREPSAGVPVHDFLDAVMRSLLLRGNAYGLITARSGPGLLPSQVELVSPDRVGVTLHPETQRVQYRIGGQEFHSSDVWHVAAFCSPGSVLGLSPVAFCAESVGLGLAAQDFGAQYFAGGPIPVGTLNLDPSVRPNSLEHAPGEQAELVRTWQDWARSGRRRGTVPVLTGVRFEPININAEESQFLETQRFNVTQIARVFGVPPEMVGGDAGNSLTYANTEARALDFLRYNLTPWLTRLDYALGALLPSTLDVRLNPDALLRSTTKERYEAHKVGIDAGFLTVNEARELENLPPLPEPRPDPSGNGGGRPVDIGAMT
jgi:HK97 family phage portal protein